MGKVNGTYSLPEIKKKERNGSTSISDRHHLANKCNAEKFDHRILFVENLPLITTVEMLDMLFKQFAGFAKVIMISARPGIAFVEFESKGHAIVAQRGLDNFSLTPE